MSKERNVEQYCEDYADEHGLPAVTDHQYAMRLKAENAELKEELRVGNHLLAVATDKQRDLETENATLKEENDHLDNVIQGLHHDLDVLRKLVEI